MTLSPFLAKAQSRHFWSADYEFPRFPDPRIAVNGAGMINDKFFISARGQSLFYMALLDPNGRLESVRSSGTQFLRHAGRITLSSYLFQSERIRVSVHNDDWTPLFATEISVGSSPGLAYWRGALITSNNLYAYLVGEDKIARVAALDHSGNLRWAHRFKNLDFQFVTVTDTYDKETLVFLTHTLNDAWREITCKISASGQIRWAVDTPAIGDFPAEVLPLLDGTYLGVRSPSQGGLIYKLNPSGSLAWAQQLDDWSLHFFVAEGGDRSLYLLARQDEQVVILKLGSDGQVQNQLGFPVSIFSYGDPYLWPLVVNGEVVVFFEQMVNSVSRPCVAFLDAQDLSPRFFYWNRNSQGLVRPGVFSISATEHPFIVAKFISGPKVTIFTTDVQTGAGCYGFSPLPLEAFTPGLQLQSASLDITARTLVTDSAMEASPAQPFTPQDAFLFTNMLCSTSFEPARLAIESSSSEFTISAPGPLSTRTVLQGSDDLTQWISLQTNSPGPSDLSATISAGDHHFFRAVHTRP